MVAMVNQDIDLQSSSGVLPDTPNRISTAKAGRRLAGNAPVTASVFVIAAASLLFFAFPQIDVAVSDWVHVPGQGFELKHSEYLKYFRRIGKELPIVLALLSFAALMATTTSCRVHRIVRPAHSIFLLATLGLGPGLLVNLVLKNNWGRARPRETLGFGGDWPFTPAWVDADHCSANCSFVSGEAAMSFWLVALAFIVAPRWRLAVISITLLFSFAVSLNRVLFGAHFLSDVVIAWAIMLGVLAAGHRLFLQKPRAGWIDRQVGRLGNISTNSAPR